MKHKKYRCPECHGTCEVDCECCGSSIACESCGGTGLNGAKMDLSAFIKAVMRNFFVGGSWALIDRGVDVGRTDGKTDVRYADFAIKKRKDKAK